MEIIRPGKHATMSTLEELDPYIDQILQGELKGRVVVEMDD